MKSHVVKSEIKPPKAKNMNANHPLIDTLENSEENTTTLLHYEPTGWDLVDDGVNRMKEVLISAEKTLDYQSVGMYGRELLITLA